MKILFSGDFTTENRGLFSVKEENAISDEIVHLIHSADFACVNLEAPIVSGGNLKSIDKYGPALCTPPTTIKYLKQCGFNCITLANNHFYDYGVDGVKDTVECLQKNNIKYVGGGNTHKVPLLIQGSTDICVLNYCESEFSVDCENGSNKLDTIQAYYDITKTKTTGTFVIVVIHGGHEGYQLPSPRMKQLYRFFIDCGANVIINHHQHCYSGYEKYHGGLIFYGLGNFFFDSIFPNTSDKWFEGYMVELDVENKSLKDFYIYPYFQCKGEFVNVRLMEEEERKKFFINMEKLNRIIADEKLLKEEFMKFVESKKKEYLAHFVPYTCRIGMALYKRGLLPSFINKKYKIRVLNAIKCESHRDICINIFNQY